jgi:hypothetical protein
VSVLALALAATAVVSRGQDEAAHPSAQPDKPVPADSAPAGYSPTPKKPVWKRLISVEAVTSTLPGAIIQQVHDWPEQWGRDRLGFEKRVGSLYGQFVVGVLIEDGVKAIHHEDTHYRRRGYGNFFGRTGYVIVHTVLARNDQGNLTMAYSTPANAYGSWAIATLWSPREFRNAGSIFEWGSAGVGVVAGTNLLREFWPDIRGVFKKKKAN